MNVLGDIIGVGLLVASAWTLAPYVLRWYRAERERYLRAKRYVAREEAARKIVGRF